MSLAPRNLRWRGLVITLWLVSIVSIASRVSGAHGSESPVRNVADEKDVGFPGLTHITVSGAVHHGNKEVEVWLETVAAGHGTPIHRHDCEEIFIVLTGSGTFFLSPKLDKSVPEVPKAFPISANTTFYVPPNDVHQVVNTGSVDMQFYVAFSRPPIRPFIYEEWSTPHAEAKEMFPIIFYQLKLDADAKHDEL
jgi:mannose-6-phosphate isomerase-like protein (cupin superfamily)